jgi:arabinose-5-phosphate isomerase
VAAKALTLTVDAVRAVAARVGPHLDAALALLMACRGGIVVTGLGKSGHVGAKLAATLTSTGSPAGFVHATEALHGDAGILAADDVLIALSNSGKTTEVLLVAELAKSRGASVLSMTGCGGSSPLCRLADVALDVGVAREADPYDLVPSASTTAAAAVGDALAIGLMLGHGFGPRELARRHPGGSLGRRLASEAR